MVKLFETHSHLSSNWLVNRIDSILYKLILDIDNDNIEQFLTEAVPNSMKVINNVIVKQLKDIFTYNIIDDITIQVPNIDIMINQFINGSRLEKIIVGEMNGIIDDVQNAIELGIKDISKYVIPTIGSHTMNIKRIAISENILANNQARANRYNIIYNNLKDQKYKFLVYFDGRTSPECKEIHQKQGYNGVSLDKLKLIIRRVAKKYKPQKVWRDYEAHYNCRSIIVKA